MTDWFDGLPLVTEQGTLRASASCLAVIRRTNISTFHFPLSTVESGMHTRPSMFVPCYVSTCVSPLVPVLWVLARREACLWEMIGLAPEVVLPAERYEYTDAVHGTARRLLCA
jgi:hypothetical protein